MLLNQQFVESVAKNPYAKEIEQIGLHMKPIKNSSKFLAATQTSLNTAKKNKNSQISRCMSVGKRGSTRTAEREMDASTQPPITEHQTENNIATTGGDERDVSMSSRILSSMTNNQLFSQPLLENHYQTGSPVNLASELVSFSQPQSPLHVKHVEVPAQPHLL